MASPGAETAGDGAKGVAAIAERTRLDSPVWTPGDLSKAVILVVLVVIGGIGTLFLLSPFVEAGTRPAALLGLLLTAAVQGGMLLALWLFAFRGHGFAWSRLGFRSAPLGTVLSSAAITLLIALVGLAFYGAVIQALDLQDLTPPSIPASFAQDPVVFAVLATIAVVIAPIVEEAFFRGFAFKALRPRWGGWPAAIISSLLFGVAHLSTSSIGLLIPTAFLGLLLVYLYVRTGSLWGSVAVHSGFNAVNVVALAASAA
jgi:membrane protease YdiL (CAAX protease family)